MITPSLDEFLKLASQGNLIPVTTRILADIETPLSAYRKSAARASRSCLSPSKAENISGATPLSVATHAR